MASQKTFKGLTAGQIVKQISVSPDPEGRYQLWLSVGDCKFICVFVPASVAASISDCGYLGIKRGEWDYIEMIALSSEDELILAPLWRERQHRNGGPQDDEPQELGERWGTTIEC